MSSQQIPEWLREWARVREFRDAKSFIHALLQVEYESYQRFQREQKKGNWPKFVPPATKQARRTPDHERDARILELLEAGQLTVRDIANRENVSKSSVRRIRDKKKLKLDAATVQKILHLHVAEHLSGTELAQRFGSSPTRINLLLREYDRHEHIHGAVPGRKRGCRGAEISFGTPREAA